MATIAVAAKCQVANAVESISAIDLSATLSFVAAGNYYSNDDVLPLFSVISLSESESVLP